MSEGLIELDIEIENAKLMFGDCLERMKEIPDESIDVILCDPPYGTMSSIGSGDPELSHGLIGETDWDTVIDTKQLMKESIRVLKHRSAMILFSQGDYTRELMLNSHGNMSMSYRMVWIKDHFGNALIAKKAPVNMFEDICVFFKHAEDMKGHPLQSYFNDELSKSKMSIKQLIDNIGNGGVRHHFTKGKVFRIPNSERYAAIQKITGQFSLGYDDVKSIDEWFKLEVNKSRVKIFNLPEGVKTKSNVLYFRKDSDSIHPTQKPTALLEDIITTYTNIGATVLDMTFGSCSTGVAALKAGRKFIGIEKDPKWYGEGVNRLLTLAP